MSAPKATSPRSVLFACTLNAVRSPMAEGLFRAMLGSKIYVDSAGLSTASLDGFAVAVLAEIGIDIRDHNTQGFDELDLGEFDLIVALSPAAVHMAKQLTRHNAVEIEYWPTDDPSTETSGSRESRLEAYRQVRDQIKRGIEKRFGS
jgi:protein-tyrosine-phosphatase